MIDAFAAPLGLLSCPAARRNPLGKSAERGSKSMGSRAQSLDPIVRDRLVCPQDHGPLLDAGDELYNPRLRVAYRVDADGIPVMLATEARAVDDEEHQRLTSA